MLSEFGLFLVVAEKYSCVQGFGFYMQTYRRLFVALVA